MVCLCGIADSRDVPDQTIMGVHSQDTVCINCVAQAGYCPLRYCTKLLDPLLHCPYCSLKSGGTVLLLFAVWTA